MPRSSYRYNQLVIGDCGHLCCAFPTVTDIGGSKPRVICDDCTRDQYGIGEEEEIAVWVRVKEQPEKAPAKPRKKAEPKQRKPMPWEVFLHD